MTEQSSIPKAPTRQIFEGLKVCDFTWVGVGPQIGRELAEHGATVIRFESHRRPDSLRYAFPYRDFIPGVDRSAFGMAYNTQKFSLSGDLSMPRGIEIAKRAIMWADVVGESFAAGSMKKLGLDYDTVVQWNPDIIYYSTCQMGQYGPHSTYGAYGMFGVAIGGFSQVTGYQDQPPNLLFNNHSDFIAPFYIITSVVAALLYRKRTGKGMYIDAGQAECGATFLSPSILDYLANGRIAERTGNRDPYHAPCGAFPCRGLDRWISIEVTSDEEWRAFCAAVGHPEWRDDPRFATLPARKQNEDELEALIADWTGDYTDYQVMAMMQEAGVPAGVVQTCEDLFADPQLKERQHYRFLEHKVIGTMAFNAPAYQLSKTPNYIWKSAPCLGEDNEYVFKDVLGYSDDDIADLLIDGTITTEADVGEFKSLL